MYICVCVCFICVSVCCMCFYLCKLFCIWRLCVSRICDSAKVVTLIVTVIGISTNIPYTHQTETHILPIHMPTHRHTHSCEYMRKHAAASSLCCNYRYAEMPDFIRLSIYKYALVYMVCMCVFVCVHGISVYMLRWHLCRFVSGPRLIAL